MNRRSTLPILALLVALAPMAGAHDIVAPASVVADGAGHFSYPVVVTVDPAVEFGSIYIDGTDNTDLGETWIDGFCMVVIGPGADVFMVEGNLADVGDDGSVYFQYSLCDGWLGEATTVILAPTVGAEAATWTSVKGLYR
jgi:hypothetical protein